MTSADQSGITHTCIQLVWWDTGQILFICQWLWERDEGGTERGEDKQKKRGVFRYVATPHSAQQPEGENEVNHLVVWVIVKDRATTRLGLEPIIAGSRRPEVGVDDRGHGVVPQHSCDSWACFQPLFDERDVQLCVYRLMQCVFFGVGQLRSMIFHSSNNFKKLPPAKHSTEPKQWMSYVVIKVSLTPVHFDSIIVLQQVWPCLHELQPEISLVYSGPAGLTEQLTHQVCLQPGHTGGPLSPPLAPGSLRELWQEPPCWRGDGTTTPSHSLTKGTEIWPN